MNAIRAAHFILYVRDQDASARFYSRVLAIEPRLHVSGMTEFDVGGGAVLGLMPERGIVRLLGEPLGDPAAGSGVARAEVYLVVPDPDAYHQRALSAGARELSAVAPRSWGHRVGYSSDPDGHVLAFAAPAEETR